MNKPPAPRLRRRPRLVAGYIRTACLVVLTVCVVGFTLATLHQLLAPLLISVFLFYLVKPLFDRLGESRAPRWVAIFVFVGLATIAVVGLTQLIYSNVRAFERRIPEYRTKAFTHVASFKRFIGQEPPESPGKVDESVAETFDMTWKDVANFAFGTAVGFLEAALMALFYMVFLFIDAHKLPHRIRRGAPAETADRWLAVGAKISQSIERYLALKTYINLGLAASTGVACLLFGLDFWILWAVLMFLANYVTYLGSIVALAPPIALGFLQFDNPWAAVGLAVVLIVLRLAWIDYIEIRFLGRQLNLSPVLLLFSITLFGFMWGMAGMVLAVPLVTAIKLILSHFENTQRYAVLMSEE